jgi:RNA polymerase sigma factor (TIGR02999 family)
VTEPPLPPITAALRAWKSGDDSAEAALVRLVYPELHQRAERILRYERPDHTLQPTALVNEAYLRLLDQHQVVWQDRLHFFSIAARLMRRVLLDHARKRKSAKRGGGQVLVPLELAGEIAAPATADLEALDQALERLAAFDPEGARLIELRFFAGLSVEETAEALGRSVSTVVRQWRAARAWLFGELAGVEAGAGGAQPGSAQPEPDTSR